MLNHLRFVTLEQQLMLEEVKVKVLWWYLESTSMKDMLQLM